MADVMVTARMSPEKKDAGNCVLEQLGTNASQAVNAVYDYIIKHRSLPFDSKQDAGSRRYSAEQMEAALAWVDGIPRLGKSNDLPALSNDEIKARRLSARGLFEGWGGYETDR